MSYTNGLDKPSDYFEATTYSGNNSNQSITSLDFAPNWVWLKGRSGTNSAQNHQLFDTVRGVEKRLASDTSNAESTDDVGLTAFNSNGWTMGSASQINGASTTYVGWSWKAGTSFTNDASATGIGTIDSSGSFNNDSGFSIVSWTGTGSNGTIKHGMNTTPSFIVVKNLGGTDSWMVYHKNSNSTPEDYILQFNTNIAATDNNTIWNDTAPTSSVFSIGTDNGVNQSSKNYIAYCFAEKKGYSKFGSYTGNGSSDGSYIHLGFKPAFLMTKRTDTTSNWHMYDNKRDVDNGVTFELRANTNDADTDVFAVISEYRADFLSNGFKVKTTESSMNASGGTYIYMAFAESPFVTSTGIPTTAR